jgi:hypothetical protein
MYVFRIEFDHYSRGNTTDIAQLNFVRVVNVHGAPSKAMLLQLYNYMYIGQAKLLVCFAIITQPLQFSRPKGIHHYHGQKWS